MLVYRYSVRSKSVEVYHIIATVLALIGKERRWLLCTILVLVGKCKKENKSKHLKGQL